MSEAWVNPFVHEDDCAHLYTARELAKPYRCDWCSTPKNENEMYDGSEDLMGYCTFCAKNALEFMQLSAA